jgi:hypothetical protein
MTRPFLRLIAFIPVVICAMLEKHLQNLGVTIPSEYPMVQTAPDSWATNLTLNQIIARAVVSAVKLEMRTDWTTHVTHVTGVRAVDKKHIASYSETREQFAQSVGAL